MDETEIPALPVQVVGRYYWANMMTLTNRDLTKLENVLQLPLPSCLNFLAEAKDIYEREKREFNKLKNKRK